MPSILALITVMFFISQAVAGNWTQHQFIYKPSLGARGEAQKNTFDAGLDRVDAHLGKYKTLGDPGYETLSAALATIAGNHMRLAIPAGTVSITANTTIPANINLKVLKGGSFAIADGATLTINGSLEAGIYQVFSSTGTGKVMFGPGAVERAFAEWWGAKADYNESTGVGTDSADAINAALAACNRVQLLHGGYKITKAIKIPYLRQLAGRGISLSSTYPGTRIYPALNSGTWIGGHCIAYNTADGSTWDVAYPTPGGLIQDLTIRGGHNNGYTDAKAIVFAGAFAIERVTAYQMKGGLKRTPQYADQVVLRHFNSSYSQGGGSDYEIDINMVGDALLIEGCTVSGGSSAGVRLGYNGGGMLISNIFNCNQTYEYNRSLTVQGTHAEGGTVSVKNSNMAFRDCQFKRSTTGPAVTVTADGNGIRGHVLFDNCDFMQWPSDNFTADRADIDYNGAAVTIRNCRRKNEKDGAVDMKCHSGIQVNYNGAPLAAFNNYSHEYSNYAELGDNAVFHHPWSRVLARAGGAYYPFAWLGTSSHAAWRGATGTYYYRGQILLCPSRMIGRDGSNENSVSVTNGGAGVLMILGGTDAWQVEGNTLRIYRGTSANSYDSYVDVPLSIWTRQLLDDGNSVNGYVWKSRTAGPADPATPMIQATFEGSLVRAVHTDAPGAGTWSRGDFVQEKDLAGNATPGWYCVTAGAPGTWKAMANLAN